MKLLTKWFTRSTEAISALMLAVMFFTFLLQIFTRYVMQAPLGWTLEFNLILWVWIVFFGCAFIVRDKDHVTFDIFYLAAPKRGRQIMALIAAGAVGIGMIYSFLPTWDYIDWMKIRKTPTVRNPFTGDKIPMRDVFSIYAVFMLAIIARSIWTFVKVLRNGPPDEDHELVSHNPEPPAIRHGDDAT